MSYCETSFTFREVEEERMAKLYELHNLTNNKMLFFLQICMSGITIKNIHHSYDRFGDTVALFWAVTIFNLTKG